MDKLQKAALFRIALIISPVFMAVPYYLCLLTFLLMLFYYLWLTMFSLLNHNALLLLPAFIVSQQRNVDFALIRCRLQVLISIVASKERKKANSFISFFNSTEALSSQSFILFVSHGCRAMFFHLSVDGAAVHCQ